MLDNSSKTCFVHFDELYKHDRERACQNAFDNEAHNDMTRYLDVLDSLAYSFSWVDSPEGFEYWEEVHDALAGGVYDKLRADQKPFEYEWHDEEEVSEEEVKAVLEWVATVTEPESKRLPENAEERKTYPIYSGFINYFPNAIAAVSHLSYKGNQQHHGDQPLHWDKNKSGDELDALMRHMIDGDWEQVAWRAMANLERKLTGHCHYED